MKSGSRTELYYQLLKFFKMVSGENWPTTAYWNNVELAQKVDWSDVGTDDETRVTK